MELTEMNGLGEGLTSNVKRVSEKVAATMEKGSDRLLSGAEAIEGQALAAAVKLSDGAKFIRETTSGDVMKDCATLVTKYPFHALMAGTIAGLFLGRSIWKNRTH
jgi:hypothetical protein